MSAVPAVHVIEEPQETLGIYDVGKTKELLERGRKAARRKIGAR